MERKQGFANRIKMLMEFKRMARVDEDVANFGQNIEDTQSRNHQRTHRKKCTLQKNESEKKILSCSSEHMTKKITSQLWCTILNNRMQDYQFSLRITISKKIYIIIHQYVLRKKLSRT